MATVEEKMEALEKRVKINELNIEVIRAEHINLVNVIGAGFKNQKVRTAAMNSLNNIKNFGKKVGMTPFNMGKAVRDTWKREVKA